MDKNRKTVVINREVFRDKVMGCWLGKNAGGTLGEPLEGKFGQDEMFDVDWYPSLPEGGIPNDDLELQLIWLQLLTQKGPGITSADFVEAWMDCIAYNFDEYGLSKENMQKGLLPPVCGWHNNAFKDCMGSPIRSELWACLAPGCPETAARYAFEDAIVDHGGGESVYGEIFNAVLESAAFVNSDKFDLLELALASIPEECRTYRCVRRCIDNYRAGLSYEDNRNDLKNAFYHPVSQYSPLNLGFQTIGWLYGTDFGDSICKAVNCGWDTDCTAATLGAVLGIIGGASSLPEKWIAPLGYEIATNMTTGGIRNLTAPTDIRELTEAVMEQAERVTAYWRCPVRFTDEEPGGSGIIPPAPELAWMEGYRADTIPFALGGLREELTYQGDAAILGDRPSVVTLRIANPHPTEKEVTVCMLPPEGFQAELKSAVATPGACEQPEPMGRPEACEQPEPMGRPEACEQPEPMGRPEACEQPELMAQPQAGELSKSVERPGGLSTGDKERRDSGRTVRICPGGAAEFTYSVTAGPRKIRESNRGWLMLSVKEEPAFPAIPLVLLGGSRWLMSPLYPGKTLDEDCGVREDEVFRSAPEGFAEQWNPGNDLRTGERFSEGGVVYALHHLRSEEEKEVVLGVPNNGRMKLFLNGKLIHETKETVPVRANLGNGGALGDLSNYKVTRLRKGWNQILVKLQNGDGPQEAHFTIGGMSSVCYKNHGMPVLGINRSAFMWE